MLNIFPLLLKGILVSATIQAAIGFTAEFYDCADNNVSQEESIECTMHENPHPAAGNQASVILEIHFLLILVLGVAQVYFHGTANCSVRGSIVQYDCLSMEEFPVDAFNNLNSITDTVVYCYQLKIVVKQVLKTLIEFADIPYGGFAQGDIKAENIVFAKLLKAEDIEPKNPEVIAAINRGLRIYGRAALIDFGLADFFDSGRVKTGGDLRFARPVLLDEGDDEIPKTKTDLFAYASSIQYDLHGYHVPWLESKIEPGDQTKIKRTCDMKKFFRDHGVPSEFDVLVRAFGMSLSPKTINYDVLMAYGARLMVSGTPSDLYLARAD